MHKGLHPIKRSEYLKKRFSHAEILEITALSADTLQTWHKRGFVPSLESRKRTGRGFRRKYSTFDAAYLTLMKHLASQVPVLEAGLASARCAEMLIVSYELVRYAETVDELYERPGITLVVFRDVEGVIRFDAYSDREDAGVPKWPFGGIQGWMRRAAIESAVVLELSNISLALFARMGDVIERQREREKGKKA